MGYNITIVKKGELVMDNIKVLRVMFQNVPLFKNGIMEVNLLAMDKVSDSSQVFKLHNSIYTQKVLGFTGINASGKTTTLKLIYFAMNIILSNESLNEEYDMVKDIIQDKTVMIVDFFCDGKYYTLQSTIGKKANQDVRKKTSLYFIDECLKVRNKSTVTSKKEVLDFNEIQVAETIKRNRMPLNEIALLKDDVSIVIKVTKDSSTGIYQMIRQTNFNYMGTSGKTPSVVINAFDPSIEELSCTSDDKDECDLYKVKFKNRKEAITVDNPFDLGNFISSGTIKGQNLISIMMDILQLGGYLIVDEFENHLNKEIIRMIMDIFKSPDLNPNGACLIFSTHYSEILDFMDRKDNIYITRRQNANSFAIEVLNYATQVSRNDVKKSEVILANYVKGTAPSYENIQALKDSICKNML